jgi:8-oxo-dGTP pyrophosphatase MutT (NUDIX family)
MAFAAGMYAFPGGGVDQRDAADLDLPWHGPAPDEWARTMGVPVAEAVGLVCAAVRETFEECGVLLAGRRDETEVVDVDDPSWEADRQRLLSRDVALSELLVERDVVLRSDLLRAWAHWTTPLFEPRRYDTWFFLAVLPPEQRARHLGGEAASSGWYSASAVLAERASGGVAMLPPTQVAVEEVATAASVAELRDAPRDLREVMPRLERVGDDLVLRTDL